jgi:hypothetical protein
MKTIGKWLYLLGMLIAIVITLIGFSNSIVSLLLALMGILAAIFFLDSSDVVNFGIRYLLLAAVYTVLGQVPAIGTYLSQIFGAVLAFLGPVALTLLVVYFVKKYFMGGKK